MSHYRPQWPLTSGVLWALATHQWESGTMLLKVKNDDVHKHTPTHENSNMQENDKTRADIWTCGGKGGSGKRRITTITDSPQKKTFFFFTNITDTSHITSLVSTHFHTTWKSMKQTLETLVEHLVRIGVYKGVAVFKNSVFKLILHLNFTKQV